MAVDAAVLEKAVKQLQGELLEQVLQLDAAFLDLCPHHQIALRRADCQLPGGSLAPICPCRSLLCMYRLQAFMQLRALLCSRTSCSPPCAEACSRLQAGRYELRLLQQAERHSAEADERVAHATSEVEAALMQRLDERSKQLSEDNKRLEGYLRMRSKVTSHTSLPLAHRPTSHNCRRQCDFVGCHGVFMLCRDPPGARVPAEAAGACEERAGQAGTRPGPHCRPREGAGRAHCASRARSAFMPELLHQAYCAEDALHLQLCVRGAGETVGRGHCQERSTGGRALTGAAKRCREAVSCKAGNGAITADPKRGAGRPPQAVEADSQACKGEETSTRQLCRPSSCPDSCADAPGTMHTGAKQWSPTRRAQAQRARSTSSPPGNMSAHLVAT